MFSCGFFVCCNECTKSIKRYFIIEMGDTMVINEKGFICCPDCGRRTKTKVNPDTALKNFPLYCDRCKKEYVVDYQPEPGARAKE